MRLYVSPHILPTYFFGILIFIYSMFLYLLFRVRYHIYRLYNICVIIDYISAKYSVILFSFYKYYSKIYKKHSFREVFSFSKVF